MSLRNVLNEVSIAASLMLAIVLFFTINLFSSELLARFRLDLTENRLYTISDQAVSTLKSLNEPISMNLFVSRSELLNLPGLSAYASRVEDLLREFERLSDDRITFSIVDPKPFSEAEDLAVGHGVQGIPLQNGSKLYFGLVASNSTDGVQVIPHFFLEREELLEYDLIRLIVQLEGRARKKIGLISSLPIQGGAGAAAGSPPQRPWTFFLQMNEIFNVELLAPSIDSLPDDIEMLFLLHPITLSESLLYEIDQFALQGHSILLAIDPYSEVTSSILESVQMSEVDAGSNLNQLTRHWGATLQSGKIVGDLPIAARVMEGGDTSGRSIDYPVWMNIQPQQLNPQDVVTAKLGNVIFATAGVLDINPELATDVTPLIRTSESAKLYDVEQFSSIASVRDLLENYEEGGERWPMAARISGRAATAFPDGPPVTGDSQEALGSGGEHLRSGDVEVVVIADTDFLHDRFWVRTQQAFGQRLLFAEASNGELINNALDNLSGDNSLIGVRARGRSYRPFIVTQRIRQAAEQRYLEHEQALQEELQRIEEFLASYAESSSDASSEMIITDEQRQEVRRIRENQLSIRRQLREVQHNLVKDIQQLESRLTLLNLLAVPLLLALAGALMCTIGVRYRDRRLALRIAERLS